MSTFDTIVGIARKETTFSVGQFFWPLKVLGSFFHHSVKSFFQHSVKWVRFFAARSHLRATRNELDAADLLEQMKTFNAAMRRVEDFAEVTSALMATLELNRQISEKLQLAWSNLSPEREGMAEDLKPLAEGIAQSEAQVRLRIALREALRANVQESPRVESWPSITRLMAEMVGTFGGLRQRHSHEISTDLYDVPIYVDAILSHAILFEQDKELARLAAQYLKAREEIIRRRKGIHREIR